MAFQKGVSGSPGGRPKKAEQVIDIAALTRQHARQPAEAPVKIAMTGKSGAARLAAPTAILDLGL